MYLKIASVLKEILTLLNGKKQGEVKQRGV